MRQVSVGEAEAIQMRNWRGGMPADVHRPLLNSWGSLLPMDKLGEVSRTTAGLWELGKNGAKSYSQMRRKWVTSAQTCEREICAHCNLKCFLSSHRRRGPGSLSPTHAGQWRGSLGMMYVLVTATAPDTALCFTSASPKALAPLWSFASALCICREKPLSCLEAAKRWGPGDAAAVCLLVIFVCHK